MMAAKGDIAEDLVGVLRAATSFATRGPPEDRRSSCDGISNRKRTLRKKFSTPLRSFGLSSSAFARRRERSRPSELARFPEGAEAKSQETDYLHPSFPFRRSSHNLRNRKRSWRTDRRKPPLTAPPSRTAPQR